jgi:hypothetical protein
MSHPRKYAIAFVDSHSTLTRLCATRLSLAEATAWLDSHRRAPSPDGQPCILRHPIARAIRAVTSGARTG